MCVTASSLPMIRLLPCAGFKDDVKEVQDGYDCGITLERFSDIKLGDISKPTKWKSTETKSRFSRVPIAGRGFALERHSL